MFTLEVKNIHFLVGGDIHFSFSIMLCGAHKVSSREEEKKKIHTIV